MHAHSCKKTIIAMVLAAALVGLGACGGGGPAAKGRYAEDALGDGIAVAGRSARYEDGTLRWIGGQDGTYESFAQAAENAEAAARPIAWLNELTKDGGSVSSVSVAPGGTGYAIYDKDGQAGFAKSTDGQTAALTPMEDWTAMTAMRGQAGNRAQPGPGGRINARSDSGGSSGDPETRVSVGGGPDGGVMFDPMKSLVPQGITALDDGFLVSFMTQGVYQYDAEGKLLRKYDETARDMGMGGGMNSSGPAVHENTMVWPDAQKGEILLFSLTDGKLTERAAYEGLDSATFVGLDGEGLFAADSAGISRWKNGAWDLIVDGGLTMLVMPDMLIRDLVCGDNGDWYAFLGGMENTQLLRFRFDPDIPAQPSQNLTVFSLYDNTTARLAIGEFQRGNPDVRVNLEVGIETKSNTGIMMMGPRGMRQEEPDNSATVEDVIRALNTQLLAGKGPDLIILDGLPLQSYIEKGVLKDISALAGRLVSEENLLANLTGAYTFDGKTYGLPSRFALPVMLGDSANLQGLNSLDDLVAAVEAYGSKEPALLRAPDQLWEETGLVLYGYDASVASFTNSDGSLDEAALAQYLGSALRLTQAIRDIYPEANRRTGYAMAISAAGGQARRIDPGAMDIANGEALIHLQALDNAMGYAMLTSQLGSMDGMEIASLFRKGYFVPSGGIGVVAAGKQQELAEAFLQTLMGSAVQDNFLADAFPVNRTAWGTMAEQLKERFSQMADTEFNDMGFPSLCEGLDTPLFVDQFVKNAVQAQAKDLVGGTISPEDAAAKIVADTRLYLAE